MCRQQNKAITCAAVDREIVPNGHSRPARSSDCECCCAPTQCSNRRRRSGGCGVPIRFHRIAVRKHHLLRVGMKFIFRFRRKHPRIAANKAFFWLLKVEESQPKPVGGTRWRSSNAVVNHQPAAQCGDIPILLASHHASRRASSMSL
jgi:hypothetical protein